MKPIRRIRFDSPAQMFVLITAIGYIFVYMAMMSTPLLSLWSTLMLNPYGVMRGQIWRLITWIFVQVPMGTSSIFTDVLLIFITLYVRLWISTMVEDTLGARAFLIYLVAGIVLTDLMSFLIIPLGWGVPLYTTYYLGIAVFLVLAATYPNQQVYFMFAVPMKMLWLGVIDMGFIAYDGARAILRGSYENLLVIIPALLTFGLLLLFPETKKERKPLRTKGQKEFRRAAKMRPATGSVHKCRICGRTEVTDPEMEFRYCSKCLGNYEYCSEHLFTHQHVKG